MIHYHGRTYHSAAIGLRLVEVSCDRCGTTYFYELVRVGSSAATAPYSIGTGRAKESAGRQAQRDRDRRLEEEAELVPCPECQWINDRLVAGYRRGRYRRAGKAAAGIAIAGFCLTLVIAWFASVGPAGADRQTITSILTVGLGGSAIIVGSILLLRRYLRRRIQPNRDHPLPPKLPSGTPHALVRNSTTGELEPAAKSPAFETTAGDGNGSYLDYQIGRSKLPSICCDCLAPSSPGFAVPFSIDRALSFAVPICKGCSRRWTLRKCLGALIALCAVAVIGLPVLLAFRLDEIIFWPALVLSGILAPTVGAMIAKWKTAPVLVKSADKARGAARLWFRNEHYAQKAGAA